MYEFDIIEKASNERNIIFGYNYKDALKRNSLKEEDCICLACHYAD